MVTERLLPPLVRALERSVHGRAALRTYRRVRYRRDPAKPRVLCVGFQKTGTSSFGKAMKELGFSHFGYDRDLEARVRNGDVQACLDFAAHFDSLDDLPWSMPEFVVEYRKRFPRTRYVLLERDESTWVRSYFGHFGRTCTEEEAIRRLRQHQERILQILAGEPFLLRMNITAGEGYEKLCPFLDVAMPRRQFPWENRGVPGVRD